MSVNEIDSAWRRSGASAARLLELATLGTRLGWSGIYDHVAKRWFDIVAVLLGSIVAVPAILALALLVSLDGGHPFYSQERVGRGGRVFRIWKLRSMVVDADDQLSQLLAADAEARVEWETTQKLRRDPRVTQFGAWLRRSSLDELPQVWNVLRGDMSLVGPRPMLPEQAPLYPGQAYYDMRPGITGLWQVSSRNDVTFADRAWFDTLYHDECSFLLDLRLLIRTVGVVLRRTGC
jgi:lipopolysaccharide/colanic/teichoic acid biosynthesis glycosyltransferase